MCREQYPGTKGNDGYAPGDPPTQELKDSYTRDLGHDGWRLKRFFDEQPTYTNELTESEIAILRMYSGPWFVAINFYLR